MSTVTIQLPESLKTTIEDLAAREGYSVSQFLASAAGEKLAVVMTMDYLRREAAAGRREDFEKYLAACPPARLSTCLIRFSISRDGMIFVSELFSSSNSFGMASGCSDADNTISQ